MSQKQFVSRLLPWVLTGGGAIGLLAAVVLTIEKVALLRDPGYIPSCSINPVLSCGSVMKTPQAEAFGFPNPLLGIAGFAVVTTIGVAVLAGARFARWFWLGLQAGASLGAVFVHWLIFQSLYRIGALCPYCMIVWAVTMPIFWYVTLHTLREGSGAWQRAGEVLARYHTVVLICWYVIVGLAVSQAFWTYWVTLL
jgi:uncharacterized membrane protein